LEWARGPGFRFAFGLMLLGVIRLLVLNTIHIIEIIRHAQDRDIPGRLIVGDALRWLFPLNRVGRARIPFALASILFHLSIIVVPIFRGAHILLWERGVGLAWPAIPQSWADYLTLAAIATAIVLLARRAFVPLTRSLSRVQDYVLPLVIAVPFASGYLAMHPGVNPFDYNATMLVHVMSGNLIFILIPFSKLSHLVLFPSSQVISEMGWHLVPDSGRRVALELGKEGEPV
jgi:nitrate reductase gamma subunit